jgi:hypothetical protein
MKRTSVLIALLMATFTAVSHAAAMGHPQCPIALNLSIANRRVVAGEPVLLTFSLKNLSGDYVKPDLGHDQTSWLHVRVVDRGGRSVDHAPQPRPLANTLTMGPVQVLGPGASWEKTIVVTRDWQISRGGTYVVTVDVNAPCAFGVDGSVPTESLISRQSLELHVAGASGIALRRTAERLAAEALRVKYYEADLTIAQLMTMPDYIIDPILRRFVFDLKPTDSRRSQIVSELDRIASPLARELQGELTVQERQIKAEQTRREFEEVKRITGQSHP